MLNLILIIGFYLLVSGATPFYCPVKLRFCVRSNSCIVVRFRPTFAFSGTTDSKGEIEILPLRGGKWILLTKVVKPYEGKDCDEISYSSTLSFQVK